MKINSPTEALTHWLVLDAVRNDDPTTQKLNSFAQLPDGWHFGEGCRTELLALNHAKTVNRVALSNGWQTDAFPGVSGEIMLSLENPEHYYEVIAEADGTFKLVEEKNDEEIQRQDVLLSDLVEKLSPNSSSCITFVLFTPHTGSPPKDASQVWLSETPARNLGEGFRSSSETVLKSEAGPFARTWEHITSNSPPRFSSGKSKPAPSLRIA